MSEDRRAEFAHGRDAARRAMARLGMPQTPLPAGADRAPSWPPGIVGSISHCATLCGSVAARSHDIRSIGIDIERSDRLPFPASAICSPDELAAFSRAPPPPGADWTMIAFVAREAFYKCDYPLHRRFLDFREGRLTLDRDELQLSSGSFSLDLEPRIQGRWLVQYGHIFAVAVIASDYPI